MDVKMNIQYVIFVTRNIFLAVILLFLLINCAEENIDSPGDELVAVRIDLQYGFQSHHVLIKFNGDQYFNTTLSESVPFAGPLAIFSTQLPRGLNRLNAFWSSNDNQVLSSFQDSVDFQLDDAEQYFIGLSVYNDSLYFIVQDSTFVYM